MPETETFDLTKRPDETTAETLKKSVTTVDFAIKDEDTFIASWALIQRHDEVVEKLTEGKDGFIGFDGFVAGLHNMHKMAVALRKQFVQPVLDSKERWMQKRAAYRELCEKRQKAELERQAEEQRKTEAKALERDAKKHERIGDVETATVLREQAKTLPLPTLIAPAPAVPKQQGSVETSVYECEIDDFDLLPAKFKTLDPNKKTERELIESKVKAYVKQFGSIEAIPGVRISSTKKESSRSTK